MSNGVRGSWLLLLALAAAAAHGDGPGAAVEYRAAQVERTLLRVADAGEERLAVGAALRSGEVLRTGWRSSARIEAPAHAAAFRLGARTRVRLAHEVPGALLELEQGRLRALFDQLTGEPGAPRLVTTPSAVLAVRGTEYGLEVRRDGSTTVTVLEGVVVVADRAGAGPPVEVSAGWAVRVRRDRPADPPFRHQLDARAFDRGAAPEARAPGAAGGPAGADRPEPGRAPGSGSPDARRGGGSGGHGG